MTPTALVVAGDPDRQAAITTALTPAFRTTGVVGGLDALLRLEELRVECVVVSVDLVDIPVVGFVNRVRERRPSLPVLLFGSSDDDGLVGRARRAGASDHVAGAERLLERAERAVGEYLADTAHDRHRILVGVLRSLGRDVASERSAEAVERLAYDRLVAADLYPVVLVGQYSAEDDEFRVHLPVEGTLPSSDAPLAEGHADLVERAVESGEVTVANALGASGTAVSAPAGGSVTDLTTGVVPFTHGDAVYGVALLSSSAPSAFGSAEQTVLAELGTVVGRAAATTTDDTVAQTSSTVENLVHELRNPLGIAMAHLDIGRELDDPASYQRVEEALQHIERLIDDFSEVAPVDGIDVLASRDLGEVATRAWEELEATEATLVVERTRPVCADQALLERLLSNLFRNAVEHGGDAVTVRVGVSESGFFVEDDGRGIDDADRDRVFERGFSRGDGSGIGLSFVADIVDAHGWTIDLVDGASGGARFEIGAVEFGDDDRRTGR